MCEWMASGRNRIDPCMRETIKQLQWQGYHTYACCCGHGKYKPTIIVDFGDGLRWDYISSTLIPRKKRFYKRDAQGVFFIPEVEKGR